VGRTLKRVPLGFDWPLNKTWSGYENPHWKPCPAEGKDCFNGYTAAGKWLEAVSRLIAMLGEQAVEAPHAEELRKRGAIYPHPYLEEWSQAPRTELPRDVVARLRDIPDQEERRRTYWDYDQKHPRTLLPLTEEVAKLVEGLQGSRPSAMQGAIPAFSIGEKLKEAARVGKRWGICKVCKGHGIDPAVRRAYERWRRKEPPKGPGYQLWQTTSEGSPISPVFETLDALCAWAETNATTFGDSRASAAEWRQMLEQDRVHHRSANGNVFL
jgi:hypothetical protein